MAYYNDDELYRYFEKSIGEQAEQRLKTLRKEIDYAYSKVMKRVKEDLILEKNLELNKGLAEIRTTYQNEINQIGVGYDEQLIKKRLEMSQAIFSDVVKKIKAFIKTKNYDKFLKERIETVLKSVDKTTFIFKVAPQDKKVKEIIESLDLKSKIEEDASIIYGGFILFLPNQNLEINETIDQRLEEQKNWFYKHSKLFIRE